MKKAQQIATPLSATQEELDRWLAQLNTHYRLFGDITDRRLPFIDEWARQKALDQAEAAYTQAERWLETHGYPWSSLRFDKSSRSYSFRKDSD